jgi:hypothetical protein
MLGRDIGERPLDGAQALLEPKRRGAAMFDLLFSVENEKGRRCDHAYRDRAQRQSDRTGSHSMRLDRRGLRADRVPHECEI